jgi:hypothetical protein
MLSAYGAKPRPYLVLGGAAETVPFENHLHAHSKPI